MGAAVTIELNKPIDASDIRSSDNLSVARNEVIRLRKELGHLASLGNYNAAKVVYDASDIVLGDNEHLDFERCVDEVAHIRRCLQLSTQSSKRRNRYPQGGISNSGGAESKTPSNSDDHSKQTSTDFDSTFSDNDHDSDSDSDS